MTSAELKTIRESMGLTVQWLADRAGVRLRTVQYWEAGRNAVPEDVAALIARLDLRMDAIVMQAMEFVRRQALAMTGKPSRVVLLRYRTDADLWRFRPDMEDMPTTYHAALIARMRRALWVEGVESVIEYMDAGAYTAWLAGRDDSEAMRAAWVGFQSETASSSK